MSAPILSPTTELMHLLAPILTRVAELELDQQTSPEQIRAIEATLEREFPHAGTEVQAIGRLLARGVHEGWLADRGAPEARFGRVAKPGPDTHQLSVDVVSMIGAGLEHTHPRGEITLGFAAEEPSESCHFEARPPGWVVLAPGSKHVPTVTGARMNLVYFLPGGAVDWHL
jgi:hypothetical protein